MCYCSYTGMEWRDRDRRDEGSRNGLVLQAKYQELVNQLLEQHSMSEHKDRLLRAFTELTPNDLPLSITRQNKIAFRGLFDKFMNTVWGFLCVR